MRIKKKCLLTFSALVYLESVAMTCLVFEGEQSMLIRSFSFPIYTMN